MTFSLRPSLVEIRIRICFPHWSCERRKREERRVGKMELRRVEYTELKDHRPCLVRGLRCPPPTHMPLESGAVAGLILFSDVMKSHPELLSVEEEKNEEKE